MVATARELLEKVNDVIDRKAEAYPERTHETVVHLLRRTNHGLQKPRQVQEDYHGRGDDQADAGVLQVHEAVCYG